MGHTDYSMGVDSWKLCCGPFCSECHMAMERQGERVAQLEEAVKLLATELACVRRVQSQCSGPCGKRGECYAARLDTDLHPIASAAVMEAGR